MRFEYIQRTDIALEVLHAVVDLSRLFKHLLYFNLRGFEAFMNNFAKVFLAFDNFLDLVHNRILKSH